MKTLLLCSSNKCFFPVSASCYFQQLLGFQKSKYRTYSHTAFLSKFKFSSLCVYVTWRGPIPSASRLQAKLPCTSLVPFASVFLLGGSCALPLYLVVCNPEEYKVAYVHLHFPMILGLTYFPVLTINIVQ